MATIIDGVGSGLTAACAAFCTSTLNVVLAVLVAGVVLQGSDDTDVPAAGMRPDGVRTEVLDGIEHYGLIDPYSRAWPDVVAGLG